ncbi:hypothetical protein [Emticicia sp. C21]|uniref:hypothetical protein n=1 Tax=Emticicia sp. C21 TaxID=2302915 RepID=UPI001E5009A6|nr:hypothetical protein [Emticicia sp. C21]
MTYKLEKAIWTEADFERMGWHDCYIYKIRVAEDLELDIDYIFQWIKPEVEGLPFTFCVAPCTLVFRQIKHLTFELKTAFDDAVEIEGIERTENEDHILWTILTQQGEIEFISEGFTQYVRQEPFYQLGQTIPYIERYGFNLDRTTTQ